MTPPPVILIVEDSDDLRYLFDHVLDRVLPSKGGPERIMAVDGDDAWSRLQDIEQDRPLLVLCDQRMPGMTGIEFFQMARGELEARDASFHLFTSASSPVNERAAEAVGIQSVRQKPFGLKRWEEELQEIIDAWGAVPVNRSGT